MLDSVPIGEEFNWVDTVSIELTTMMLASCSTSSRIVATTRWSDVTTAGPETGIVESEDQRRAELMECGLLHGPLQRVDRGTI